MKLFLNLGQIGMSGCSVHGDPREKWHLGGERRITSPVALAVLAANLVSGCHLPQGEARSAIELAISSPTLSEFLVLNAPQNFSHPQICLIAFLKLKTENAYCMRA